MIRIALASLALALVTAAAASADDKKVVKRAEIRVQLKLAADACYQPLADEIARQPGVSKSHWDGKAFAVAYDPDQFSQDRLMHVVRAFADKCPARHD